MHANGRHSLVPCGRSNSCSYCAWKAVAQNMAVVALDAKVRQPRHGITLTTRDPAFSPERYRDAMRQWFRWLRSEVGEAEYLALIEHTVRTRLMHQHTLVKGLPDGDCDELWREGKRLWEKLTGAYRIEIRELRTPAGAIAYMVAHHHKGEQAPPPWWSGKRFRPSRRYFHRPVKGLREQVKRRHALRARVEQLVRDAHEAGVELDELERRDLEQTVEPARVQVVRVERHESGLLVDENGSVIERGLRRRLEGR